METRENKIKNMATVVIGDLGARWRSGTKWERAAAAFIGGLAIANVIIGPKPVNRWVQLIWVPVVGLLAFGRPATWQQLVVVHSNGLADEVAKKTLDGLAKMAQERALGLK